MEELVSVRLGAAAPAGLEEASGSAAVAEVSADSVDMESFDSVTCGEGEVEDIVVFKLTRRDRWNAVTSRRRDALRGRGLARVTSNIWV